MEAMIDTVAISLKKVTIESANLLFDWRVWEN